jgi:hypothetical protein
VGIGHVLSALQKASTHSSEGVDPDILCHAAFGCLFVMQSALQTAGGEFGGSRADSAVLCQLSKVCGVEGDNVELDCNAFVRFAGPGLYAKSVSRDRNLFAQWLRTQVPRRRFREHADLRAGDLGSLRKLSVWRHPQELLFADTQRKFPTAEENMAE